MLVKHCVIFFFIMSCYRNKRKVYFWQFDSFNFRQKNFTCRSINYGVWGRETSNQMTTSQNANQNYPVYRVKISFSYIITYIVFTTVDGQKVNNKTPWSHLRKQDWIMPLICYINFKLSYFISIIDPFIP